MSEEITITIEGKTKDVQRIVEGFKKSAIKLMNNAQSLEEAKQIWDRFKYFHKDKDFFLAKEKTKERIR